MSPTATGAYSYPFICHLPSPASERLGSQRVTVSALGGYTRQLSSPRELQTRLD